MSPHSFIPQRLTPRSCVKCSKHATDRVHIWHATAKAAAWPYHYLVGSDKL